MVLHTGEQMLSMLTRVLVSNVCYSLLTEITDKPPCARAVYNLLPTSQDNISYLVDMVRAKPLIAHIQCNEGRNFGVV